MQHVAHVLYKYFRIRDYVVFVHPILGVVGLQTLIDFGVYCTENSYS
jgi:hypothetical protein